MRGNELLMLALFGAAMVASGADLQPVDGLELQPRVPVEMRNPWPEEWERSFRHRLEEAVAEEGGRIWTAEAPGPNLELILQLEAADADAAAHARMQLAKMWRDADGVRRLIEQSRAECATGNPTIGSNTAPGWRRPRATWPARRKRSGRNRSCRNCGSAQDAGKRS